MSYKTLRIGKREVALGLSWSVAASKSEVKRFARQFKTMKAYPFDGGQFIVTGTDAAAAKGKKLMPAGALIGAAHPNIIVAHDLGDGTAWICAIKDGLPLPGEDQFVPIAEARARITDLSMSHDVPIMGFITGSKMSMEELLQSLEQAIINKEISEKALRNLETVPTGVTLVQLLLVAIAVLVVTTLALAAVRYKDQLSDSKRREALRQQMLTRESERLAEEAKLRALKAQYLARVDEERGKVANGSVVVGQYESCEKIRLALPFSLGGYAPQKLTCDFVRNTAEVLWQPTQSLVSVQSRTVLPGIKNALAVEAQPVSEFSLTSASTQSAVRSVDMGRARLEITHWATLRLPALTVSTPSKITLNPPAELKDDPEVRPVTVGEKAEWSVSTAGYVGYLMARSVMQLLSEYPASITQVSWSNPVKPDAALQANGFLYANSQD